MLDMCMPRLVDLHCMHGNHEHAYASLDLIRIKVVTVLCHWEAFFDEV
jgi:hypothetical protein